MRTELGRGKESGKGEHDREPVGGLFTAGSGVRTQDEEPFYCLLECFSTPGFKHAAIGEQKRGEDGNEERLEVGGGVARGEKEMEDGREAHG